MKLVFLGTRGEIEARSGLHHMHSSLMISYGGRSVMIDCGADWLGRFEELNPRAIVITHAHPDHAWGLKGGSPCPVYATAISWELMDGYPIEDGSRHVVKAREPLHIEDMVFEAFEVEHSTHCPAVSYRITAGRAAFHYAPDVAYIHDRGEALRGVKLYIGDGATMKRPMIRKRGDRLVGHAPVRTQLTWCKKEGVPRAVFTHCGSGIVKGEPEIIATELERLAVERGVEAAIAHDGLEMILR
ncbi:MAG: MBL fold metallo-hydrolase [Actinomycetota bacterium]|nr:MBL fold metallo-hydrolase [Actinomycetota bacterium]